MTLFKFLTYFILCGVLLISTGSWAANTRSLSCNFDAGVGLESVNLTIAEGGGAIISKATISSVFDKDVDAKIDFIGSGMIVFSTANTLVAITPDDYYQSSHPNALIVVGSFAQRGSSHSAAVPCNIK